MILKVFPNLNDSMKNKECSDSAWPCPFSVRTGDSSWVSTDQGQTNLGFFCCYMWTAGQHPWLHVELQHRAVIDDATCGSPKHWRKLNFLHYYNKAWTTWRTRSQSQTGEQNHRKSLSGQHLSGKSSKSVCIWKQFQQPIHQTRALPCHYRKSGHGRTLWNTVHVKIQSERVFEMLPWSFKLSFLSFNLIFKRFIHTLWNPRVRILSFSFHPTLFCVLLCNHCHSHSLFHHPLHSHPPAIFGAVVNGATAQCWVSAGHRAGHHSKCPEQDLWPLLIHYSDLYGEQNDKL